MITMEKDRLHFLSVFFLPDLDQHSFYSEINKEEKSTSTTSASHKMADLRCLGKYYLRSVFFLSPEKKP